MSMNLTLKDQILSEQGCLSPGADFLEIVILMPSWQLVHDNRNEQLYRMAVDLLLAYADQSKESPQPSVWEMAPRVLQTIADTVRLLAIDDFGDGLTCTPLELDTGLFKISLHTMTAKEVGEQARTDTEQVSSPSQRGVDIDLTSEMVEWMSWSPNASRRGSEQGSPRIEVEDVENDLGTHQDAEARDVPSAEAARDAVEAPVGLSSEVQSQEGRGDHTRLGEMQRVLHTVEYDLKHRLERERTALREAAAARDHVQKLQNGLDDAEYRLDQQYAKYADKQKELIYLKGDKTKLQGEHDELLQKWDSQAAEIHSQTRTIGQNKKIISRQADELGNLHDEISARNDELVALCSDLKQARESLLREKARAAELSCDLSLLRKKLKYGGMKKDQLLALIEGLNLPSQSPRATKAELISLILDNEVVEEDGQSR